MPSEPLPEFLPPSGFSPALRLPENISTKQEQTATNFSHPFEPEFASSPFVIPDFGLHANTRANAAMTTTVDKRASMTEAGHKFRPTSSIYSYSDQRYIYGRTSDDFVNPESPTGSVFNTGNPGPSNFMGRAMTTTPSQDEALKKTNSKRRSMDVVEAAKLVNPGGRGMTALPSMRLDPYNAKVSDETAGTNVTEEGAKDKKRGSFQKFRKFSLDALLFRHGRKRRATLESETKKENRKSAPATLTGFSCVADQPSMVVDEEDNARDDESIDPTTAFLTPVHTHDTTTEAKGKRRTKSINTVGTPGTATNRHLRYLSKSALISKVNKLKGRVSQLEHENTQLRAANHDLRTEWHDTNWRLIQEEFKTYTMGLDLTSAKGQAAIAQSELPLVIKRMEEARAKKDQEDSMSLGQLLDRNDGWGYQAGTMHAERAGVRESWVTDWMVDGDEVDDAAPGPEVYRTRNSE